MKVVSKFRETTTPLCLSYTKRAGASGRAMEDEFKNLGITSEDDTTSTAKKASEAVCSTCGEPNATKKCKKRHGGGKNKKFSRFRIFRESEDGVSLTQSLQNRAGRMKQMWVGNLLTMNGSEVKASPATPSEDELPPTLPKTPTTTPDSTRSSASPTARSPPAGGRVLALTLEVTTVTELDGGRETRDVRRAIKWTTDGSGTRTVEKRARFIDGVLEGEVVEASDGNIEHLENDEEQRKIVMTKEVSEEDRLNFDRIWDHEKAFIPSTMADLV